MRYSFTIEFRHIEILRNQELSDPSSLELLIGDNVLDPKFSIYSWNTLLLATQGLQQIIQTAVGGEKQTTSITNKVRN